MDTALELELQSDDQPISRGQFVDQNMPPSYSPEVVPVRVLSNSPHFSSDADVDQKTVDLLIGQRPTFSVIGQIETIPDFLLEYPELSIIAGDLEERTGHILTTLSTVILALYEETARDLSQGRASQVNEHLSMIWYILYSNRFIGRKCQSRTHDD